MPAEKIDAKTKKGPVAKILTFGTKVVNICTTSATKFLPSSILLSTTVPNVIVSNFSGSGATQMTAVNANTPTSSGVSASVSTSLSLGVLGPLIELRHFCQLVFLVKLGRFSQLALLVELWLVSQFVTLIEIGPLSQLASPIKLGLLRQLVLIKLEHASLFNWQYLSRSQYSQHQPNGNHSCPKESQSDFKTNTVQSKHFVKPTKTECINCNHMALSEMAEQFSLLLTTVSNTDTDNKMVGLCSPSAASPVPPTHTNKSHFQAKKKATKSKKTKARAQPSTPTHANKKGSQAH